MHLDDIDRTLLKLLQEDASRTTKELAALVNLSVTPVFERVKRLEKNGVIKKYTAIVDSEQISKGFVVFCHIRLKQHSRMLGQAFRDSILAFEEITECYSISGSYDFIAKIYVKSMRHYQDFVLNKLGVLESIGQIQSDFVMGVLKETHALPISDD